MQRVSACIATSGRPGPLRDTLLSLVKNIAVDEIVVCIDACSETESQRDALVRDFPSVRWISTKRALGPGLAKDLAIRHARNEICLVVDDDIEFLDVQGTSHTLQLLEDFAVVQSGIYDETGKSRRSFEYPALFFRRREEFEISYFVGAIHWLRRSAYLSVGGYKDFEGYGFEELALSLRLLRSGYRLFYSESIKIKHYRVPTGRPDAVSVSKGITRNRFIIAEKFFPLLLATSQKFYWATVHFRRHGNFHWPRVVVTPERLRWRDLVWQPRLAARALF